MAPASSAAPRGEATWAGGRRGRRQRVPPDGGTSRRARCSALVGSVFTLAFASAIGASMTTRLRARLAGSLRLGPTRRPLFPPECASSAPRSSTSRPVSRVRTPLTQRTHARRPPAFTTSGAPTMSARRENGRQRGTPAGRRPTLARRRTVVGTGQPVREDSKPHRSPCAEHVRRGAPAGGGTQSVGRSPAGPREPRPAILARSPQAARTRDPAPHTTTRTSPASAAAPASTPAASVAAASDRARGPAPASAAHAPASAAARSRAGTRSAADTPAPRRA